MPIERDTGVDELAELRRRAYGPHADIATDPEAQARLHELEALERETRSTHEFSDAVETASEEVIPARTAPSVEAPAAVAEDPAAPAESVATSIATEAPSEVGSTSLLHTARKRMPWLIAVVAGAVALVAVIALVVGEFSRPNPEVSLPARTLPSTVGKPDLSESMRQVWGIPDAPLIYRGTLGRLNLWTTTDGSEWDCVLLSMQAQIYRASCAHRPLPAMVDFVTENATFPPESLDPPIPVGSFLRFVWEGDMLNVYVARLAEDEALRALPAR
ncbi:hypothetical protein [Microbacterium sp. P5_E9]